MKTAMESIKEMVDVNTVVGDPVETQDGQVIVPISRVTFGFAAGGAEYGETKGVRGGQGARDEPGSGGQGGGGFPFGGGSGAGVSVQPVGFLVVGQRSIRLLPVDGQSAMVDRLIDLAPQVIDKLQGAVGGRQHGGQGGGQGGGGRKDGELGQAVERALEQMGGGGNGHQGGGQGKN